MQCGAYILFLAATSALALVAAPAGAGSESVDQLVHTALELDVNPTTGGKVYAQQCSRCHGVEGRGDAARGIPALAGQRQAYLVRQLASFAERDRNSRVMHAIVSRPAIAEPQVWANIAAYVNALPRMHEMEHGDGRYVNLGEAIFREQCSSCHGEDARGDDDGFVPSLRNQHYSYLLNETRTMSRWHTRNLDEDLARFMDSLDEDEMVGLADYLSRQQGPTRDRLRMRKDGNVGD